LAQVHTLSAISIRYVHRQRVARGQRGMLRGKMLGPALFVVSGTLASAVSTRSRAAAQAMANVASDGCAGEGVTTTPLLIYASMDRGNKLYSLRGGASKDILDSAEPDNQQEELMSGDDLMTESGNKTGDDKNETPISPLCLALFRSLRGTDDNHKLNFCINQHKEATQQASAFLQEFDENSAQEVLQPTLLKCLRSEVNLPTAQLMEGGGCLSGFTTDFVTWEMKNKGRGISQQCRAEACIKFNSAPVVEECAHKFDDALESVEDMEEAAKVYEKILTQCAGVSDLCARQNGYPMAFKANQQMLKQIGIPQR